MLHRLLLRLLLLWWWQWRLLDAVGQLLWVVYLRRRRVCIWMGSLRVRRRVLGRLLLHWWWWDVLLWRWSGGLGLPINRRHVCIVGACLTLRWPCGGTSGCL